MALLEPQPGTAATSLLLDVTGNLDKAKALLAKARADLKARGARDDPDDSRSSRLRFAVPLPQAQQVAAGQGGAAAAAATAQTVYFLTENLFGACDDLAVVQEILARLVNGSRPAAFPKSPAYQMVMKRCAADAPEHVPSIRWFIYPLGYAEATRAATPPEKRRKGKTIIEIMRNQGYAAFQGVGGYVDVSADGYQIVHRTAVFAPPPYTESMKMFVFPNGKDFTPQPWVGRDVATYFTVYVDILNAFDNFGPLYDEIIGEKDVWKQTARGHENRSRRPADRSPQGAHRQPRPAGHDGRRLQSADHHDQRAAAVGHRGQGRSRRGQGHRKVRQQRSHDQEAGDRRPRRLGDCRGGRHRRAAVEDRRALRLTPKKDDGKSKPDEKDDDQEKESHFLPHGAITVAHGQLFIASHIDFLVKTLKPLADEQPPGHAT